MEDPNNDIKRIAEAFERIASALEVIAERFADYGDDDTLFPRWK